MTIGGALNANIAIQPLKTLFYWVIKAQVWLPKSFTSALKSEFQLSKVPTFVIEVLSGQKWHLGSKN